MYTGTRRYTLKAWQGAASGELRRDPERAEIQGEGMSSGDEGLSSI